MFFSSYIASNVEVEVPHTEVQNLDMVYPSIPFPSKVHAEDFWGEIFLMIFCGEAAFQ